MRQTLFEWFAQDSWRGTRKLNIDYGVRWTWSSEMYPHFAAQQSVFMRTLYQASQTPPLYAPITQNGIRFAQNPVTAALLPAAYIGPFVPLLANPPSARSTSGNH